jgi:hypothetical protein
MRHFNMKIRIIFDTEYELVVDLFDNDFVKNWSKLLRQEIASKSLLQEDTYSSFIPESLARLRLEEAIDSVNVFLKREFISKPCVSDYENPNFYNKLHEKFEKLTGPNWDTPTRLMVVAPDRIKLAIKHINRYCHRLEQRPYVEQSMMRLEFNTHQRTLLTANDYNLFRPITESNTVFLDYATLGKSLYECYQDKLSAQYNGIKVQQHYCANFILQFNQPNIDYTGFKNWCVKQGITEIPVTELGKLQIGTISDPESFEQVKKTAKILDIILE